ncbi:MAG: hypothetical protein ABSG96_21655 [Terracidiphilus sp.]
MADQSQQGFRDVMTVPGQQSGLGMKVDETQHPASEIVPAAVSQSKAEEAPALTENRVFAYGAIAATIGIVAGLAFAALAGHGAPRSARAASASSNSNATALATAVKPETAAPADANIPPVELPAAQTAPDLQPRPSGHRKARKKDLDVPARFAIEGDDELVGYDPSKGVLQTSARKTFLVNATTVNGNSHGWQDWPANIHYKCDLNASCTLTRSGASVLYAQLKK